MAIVRYEITITDATGNVLCRFPSTTKAYANVKAKIRAKELNGIATVKPTKSVTYNPADWQ